MIPPEDHEEQNRVYRRNGFGMWRVIGFCREPTLTLENLDYKALLDTLTQSL